MQRQIKKIFCVTPYIIIAIFLASQFFNLGCTNINGEQPLVAQIKMANCDEIIIAKGTLITNNVEKSLGRAKFKILEPIVGVFPEPEVTVIYFIKTLQGDIPSNPILVLQKINPGYYKAVGHHAEHGFHPDTDEIRNSIKAGKMQRIIETYPSEQHISFDKAICILTHHLKLSSLPHSSVEARRYEFGWILVYTPVDAEGNARIGGHNILIVSDKGEVVAEFGGL